MSMEMGSEHVYYLPCSFCNTILAVSVPCTNLLNIVTIRCGHCSNLQSVNMGALLPAAMPFQGLQAHAAFSPQPYGKECGSSSSRFNMMNAEKEEQRVLPNRPPEKRQRVPSAYNRFIKEEIQRIKACNPDISHKEAFSTAAKNERGEDPITTSPSMLWLRFGENSSAPESGLIFLISSSDYLWKATSKRNLTIPF